METNATVSLYDLIRVSKALARTLLFYQPIVSTWISGHLKVKCAIVLRETVGPSSQFSIILKAGKEICLDYLIVSLFSKYL